MTDSMKESTRPRGLRILVVEDEADALKSTLDLLEALGHQCGGLTNAELALDRYLEGAFDVIITDVELPGLSGQDLADILGNVASVPIIFATGRPPPAHLPPRRVWLRKPFTIEQMSQALAQAVGMDGGTGATAAPTEPTPSSGLLAYGALRAA